METRCRLCAEEKPLNEIECTIKDHQTNIRQMLLDCCRWTSFEGSEYDNLPKIVCTPCYITLKESWRFSCNVARAQEYLLDYFGGSASGDVDTIAETLVEDESTCIAFEFKMEQGNNELDANYATEQSDGDDDTHMDDVKSDDNLSFDEIDENDAEASDDKGQLKAKSSKTNKNSDDFALPNIVVDKKYQLMQHVDKAECNADGTISLEAVQRLQLMDWTIVKYRCYICQKIVTNSMTLKRHLREEHPGEAYKYSCIFCSKIMATSRSTSLTRHVKRTHLRYLEHCCVHCNQYYWDIAAMKKHSQTHKWDEQKGQFLCDTCGKESDSLKQFYAHNRLHMEIPKKTFECFMCRKRFTSKHSLKCHMRLHMTTEKIGQQCSICLMIFSRKDALRRHLLIHTGQYIYNCDICGKGFRTAGNLKIHYRIHTGEKPFACTICDYRSIDGPNLNKHMKQRHGVPYYKKAEKTWNT